MKYKKILVLAILISQITQAKELISCEPRITSSDSGEYIEIQSLGSNLLYTFSSDSYSGRKINRQRNVFVGSLKMEGSCKLTVYTSDNNRLGSPMFYVYKHSPYSKWKVLGVGDQPAPDLVCEVDLEYEYEKCNSAEDNRPIGINPN